MTEQQAVMAVSGGVLAILMLTFYVKTGKPVRAFLGSAVPGVLALAVIDYAAFFTGVGLLVNVSTIFMSVVLGLPGVILVLALRMLWGIA